MTNHPVFGLCRAAWRTKQLGTRTLLALGLVIAVHPAAAADNPSLLQEDFPFQGAAISAKYPVGNVAVKGLAIRLGHTSGLTVDKAGVHLAFTQPLDEKEASDPQNYSGKRWNLRRTANYGSDDYSMADPKKKGRDTLDITAAKLSPDGRTVTLTIDDLRPANVEVIRFKLKAKDGTPIQSEVQHTIHAIP